MQHLKKLSSHKQAQDSKWESKNKVDEEVAKTIKNIEAVVNKHEDQHTDRKPKEIR